VYDRWGNRTIHQTNSWGTGVNKKDFTVNTANNRLGVPSGQAGAMSYDAAGNLINDTYTGAGSRVYDAENRMSKAWGGNNQWQEYSYNADGLRVRRKIDGSETRQIYGIAGELLAEYAGTASPATPQREYGYRNGQLLVTASAPVGTGTGLQGQYFDNMNFTDLKVTRTDATVNFDWGGGTPDPVISVDTFTTRWQGKVEPQYSQTYTFYTLTDDGVRLWVNGQLLIDKWIDQGPTEWSGQIALTAGLRYDIVMEFYENGGGATAKLSWSSASQTKQIIPQARLYPPGSSSQVSFEWLVADQLGTPRIILDKTGSLASTRRHDYSPFGEELYAGMGGRTTALGYTADTIRQKFTSKERDNETQLDYFLARYYSSTQGRFTSVDPIFFQKEMLIDPQRYNRYSYVRNNPLKYIDPEGQAIELLGDEEHRKAILEQLQKAVGQKAGALLYENKITDKNGNTRYFVGISGKAGDFAKINSLAAGFAAVIGDRRVAKLSIVAEDTKVQGYSSNQKALITAKDTHWVDPNPAITFPSSYGETTTYLLDPKVKYPHLPYLLMEDFKGAWDVAPSDVLAHEIGHVAAEWGLIVGDHKHISVAFENEARRLRDPNAKLRTGHSEPGDARRENWKLGIKIP
ncbi:MAG TPA: PA14 domain-containing protein, partial [Pyrinomonadaceae bacterium]|nr:PA14 domain-containing protein [Pyrinomonadaceae bacterium]